MERSYHISSLQSDLILAGSNHPKVFVVRPSNFVVPQQFFHFSKKAAGCFTHLSTLVSILCCSALRETLFYFHLGPVKAMPHHVSPPMAPTILVKSADATPSTADVASICTTVFTAKTSQESLDAAYALTDTLISVGFQGLQRFGIVEEIRRGATDKKDGSRRESSMILLGALFERLIPAHPITEVLFLLQDQEKGLVALALDALADKGSVVRESAQYALDALFQNLSVESLVIGLLPVLSRYLGKRSGKWQGAVGAYALIGQMADKAKMGMGSKEEELSKDLFRESMGKRLASLIPIVENGMHDLKTEVSSLKLNTIHKLILP